MRNKVLIVGPYFYDYLDSLKVMYSHNGWDSEVISYNIENTNNPFKRSWNNHNQFKLQQRIIDAIKLGDITVCLMVKGYEKVTDETYNSIKNRKIPMILFLQDSITRLKLSPFLLKSCSLILTFEPSDIELINELDTEAKVRHFGVAYNPYIYKCLALTKKYDICFAGNFHKGQRFEIISAISSQLMDKKIAIVGPFWNFWSIKSMIKYWKFPFKKNIINGQFGAMFINRIYNQSKIVLNIQDPQNKIGFNPRTIEIAASGSFQLTDLTTSLRTKDWFEALGEHHGHDVINKIEYYLENNKLRMSKQQMAIKKSSEFTYFFKWELFDV